jgi:GcrA cell cycle regulator
MADDADYDGMDDFAKSLLIGYEAIRARVAAGGHRGFMGEPTEEKMEFTEPCAPLRLVKLPDLSFWTDERTTTAKRLFAEGFSYTEIGREIGTTRNAICGKLTRLGIFRFGPGMNHGSRTVGEPRKPRSRSTSGAIANIRRRWPDVAPDIAPEAPLAPTLLFDLKPHQCRWPCGGSGIETIFCGGQRAEGSSYCAGHFHISHAAPRLRAARARVA